MNAPASRQSVVGFEQGRPAAVADVVPIPSVTIAAFCETAETREAVLAAAADRRMLRAKVDLVAGGLGGAIDRYEESQSPNLIVLERRVPSDLLLEELERLAQVCNPDTRVLLIGAVNDVALYRELVGRGVSDYLVAPVRPEALIAATAAIFRSGGPTRVAHSVAFVGTKGGVGSSTIAHNVAAHLSRISGGETLLADMDLGFGTAALDFNIDIAQGVAEALDHSGALDHQLLERLLGTCEDKLKVLSAPVTLDRTFDLGEEAFDELLEVARGSTDFLLLDVPHVWSSWARRLLVAADEVVLTASPDLASLRNAKSIVEALSKARPNDAPPRIVLNCVGLPKRPEIKPADFAKALQLECKTIIPFDARLFGTAANNGQMIGDVSKKAAQPFARLAAAICDDSGKARKRSRGGFLHRLFGG